MCCAWWWMCCRERVAILCRAGGVHLRDAIPDWLLDELLGRLARQRDLPRPQMKVSRGRMFSRVDYAIDVAEWGFADVGGEGDWRND